MKLIIAVDPGTKGALAWRFYWGNDHCTTGVIRFSQRTTGEAVREAFDNLAGFEDHTVERVAYVERVSAMPGQGVSSTFKFGAAFGRIQGALEVAQVPVRLVTPAQWMKGYGLPKAKDGKSAHKRALREVAVRLYPDRKVTLEEADALVLLDYAIRTERLAQ